MLQADTLATLMKSLADPTRRAIFERIATQGELTVGELQRGSHVSQPAVSQHVRALKEAGLLAERRHGRNTYYRASPQGLAPLVDWLGHYRSFWRDSLHNLERLLKEIDR
jgi:DNA-binding transcriptional ArsR family regulator